jgi:hypothetical protein
MSLTWHLIMARSGHKERLRSHLSALQNPLLSSLSPALSSFSLSLLLSLSLSLSLAHQNFWSVNEISSLFSNCILARPLSPSHRRHKPLQFSFYLLARSCSPAVVCFYLVFCFPVARNFGDPRVSGVQVRGSRWCWALFRWFFLVRFLNVCVCVCSCLLCVYVFLCFIQVKALVVAFLAEFLSFVFRIVFASVIGRSKRVTKGVCLGDRLYRNRYVGRLHWFV